MTNEEFIKSVSYEGEVWKDVPEFEGYYVASNLGRIIAVERTIIRKNGAEQKITPHLVVLFPGGKGYLYYTFCKNGIKKTKLVHRVIASAFLDNPNNLQYVDHIDGNRYNNCVTNLKWASPSDNRNNETTLKRFE